MSIALSPQQALRLLSDVALEIVREKGPQDHPDFTFRQLSILMTIYLEKPPHTVRGIAACGVQFSTLTMVHTATRASPGSFSAGRLRID